MATNPKFTVLYEKLRGKTFAIDRESMSIGRKEGMDIHIPDGSISSHHADIIRSERDGHVCYILRDNDSTNGTRINNMPITEQALKNSDLIMFGNVEVLFDGAPSDGEVDDNFSQSTHTIDISSIQTGTGTAQTLSNFNPLADQEKRQNSLIRKAMLAGYVLLGAGILFMVIKVILKLFR